MSHESRADYSRKVVSHALLTAFALDAVGYALEGYTKEEREEWVDGARSFVPKNRTNHRHDNRGTVNTLATAFALEAVTSLAPDDASGLSGFRSRYVDVAAEYRRSFKSDARAQEAVAGLTDPESTVAVCVACAVACYCSVRFDGVEAYYDLAVPALQALEGSDDQRQTAFVAGFLANSLVHSGFFVGSDLENVLSHDLYPPCMGPALEAMAKNSGSYAFIRDSYRTQLTDGLPYPARVLSEVLFYMLRVGTGMSQELDNLPRMQLRYVLGSPNAKTADLGFLYGLLCLCSEHEHCLILHDLRESAERKRYVEDLLAVV